MREDSCKFTVEFNIVDPIDTSRILEAHNLLVKSFPPGQVEDFPAFLQSTASAIDFEAVPVVLTASISGHLVGVIIGNYLSHINIGMILYAAVHTGSRRRGIYSAMRRQLIEIFKSKSEHAGSPNPDFIVSEVDPDGIVYKLYRQDWQAFVAPFDYWQPATQGLSSRRMKLVLQPLQQNSQPNNHWLKNLISNIYTKIYRLSDPEGDPDYQRVIQSFEAVETHRKSLVIPQEEYTTH